MRRTSTLAVALVVMAAPSVAASSDYLLTLPPGKGEVAGKSQEVPVQTFGWGKHSGQSTAGASGRPAAGSAAYGSMGRGLDIAVVDGPPPTGPGVLMIQGKLPGCTIGKRYSGAQFASASMRYELKDVVISNCAADGMALDYGKVTVRGWNPEPKQQ